MLTSGLQLLAALGQTKKIVFILIEFLPLFKFYKHFYHSKTLTEV